MLKLERTYAIHVRIVPYSLFSARSCRCLRIARLPLSARHLSSRAHAFKQRSLVGADSIDEIYSQNLLQVVAPVIPASCQAALSAIAELTYSFSDGQLMPSLLGETTNFAPVHFQKIQLTDTAIQDTSFASNKTIEPQPIALYGWLSRLQ